MDFSGWKKLKEDDKSCTLEHPKGHVMTIAIKALPKIQQEAIKRLKMADGGRVDDDALSSGKDGTSEQGRDVRMAKSMSDVSKNNPNDKGALLGSHLLKKNYEHNAKEEARGRAKFEREHVKPKMKGLAEGGKVSYVNPELAEKGRKKLEEKHHVTPERQEKINQRNREMEKDIKGPGGDLHKEYPHYASGTQNAPVEGDDSATDVAASADQSAPDSGASPVHNGSPIVINVGAGQPQPQPVAQVPEQAPAPESSSLPEQAQGTLGAIEQQKAALKGQQAIDTAKAQAAEPAIASNIQAQQDLQASAQKALDDVNKHVDAFNSYMDQNGVINPKHYQENMGSGQKVSTAIGLFLGGLGTPFGGHNYAFDFLNKQIDRDIASQQQNVENKKTVLGAYQQLYGENTAAILAARATMDHIYAKRIEQAAIQQGTAQAKVNAEMGISKLMNDSIDRRHEAAALLSNGGGSPQNAPAKATQEKGKPVSEHILSPNSNDIFKKIQYDPTLKPYIAQIAEQKAKADLADKAIDAINDVFPMLEASSKGGEEGGGGLAGYMQRKGSSMAGVPIIGGPLAQASELVTDRPENRVYTSAYSRAIGAVRGALQGNIAEDLLERTVKANTPELGDPDSIVKYKLKNLKQFVKEHTRTDMLDMAKLTGK